MTQLIRQTAIDAFLRANRWQALRIDGEPWFIEVISTFPYRIFDGGSQPWWPWLILTVETAKRER